jgi:hypothetical protein
MDNEEMRRGFAPVPDVQDWTVVQHAQDIYIESATIAHGMRNYDDAWLKVAGNMTLEEKRFLAQAIADRLNSVAGRVAAGKDAERYRWLRQQHWNESALCVVAHPKDAVKLGHSCPSHERLDDAIDNAMVRERQA